MSEPAVDVDSKTSLFKRWWVLAKADIAKGAKAYTSVGNWVFMGISVWLAVGPYFAAQGAQQANAQVAQLQQDLTNAIGREASASLAADKNRAAYQAVEQDRAMLAAELDALRNKDQPKQEASLTPPVVKVKVRKVPSVKPKEEPSTCDQIDACKAFVAWYEQNVGTGAN